MRLLSPLLVCLAIVSTSCSSSPANQNVSPQLGAPTANTQASVSGSLDLAGVEKLVRDRLQGSQVDKVQAEKKDVQWVANNLGLAGNTLSLTTPVWVIVARGNIRGGKDAGQLTEDMSFTYTTANFVVVAESGEFIKTRLDGRQPLKLASAKIDAAAAEQAVRTEYQSSQLDDVKAELKTYQWVNDNLGNRNSMYTIDSPVWIVTARGKLQGRSPGIESGSTPPTFKVGTFAVDTETGLIMSTTLSPNEFTPQAAPSPDSQSTVESTYLSPLRPSPHP